MSRKRIIVNVKSDVFLTDHYQIEGNIIEASNLCMLLEKTSTQQKNVGSGYTPSSQFDAIEQSKPYAVIMLNKDENEVEFFKYLEDARKFYESKL
jgi:hypothetical protein